MDLKSTNNNRYITPEDQTKISRIINYMLPALALFMFSFIPTSYNEEIFGVSWTIGVWLVIVLVILLIVIMNKINYNNLIVIFSFTLCYMSFITFLSINMHSDARISLARIAPIVSLLILTSVSIRNIASTKYMKVLLDIFFILMIIWNSLILLDSELIKNFTRNFYSQYYELALYYSMIRDKPVMSYGVHTYASYFYFITFYLSYVSAKLTHQSKYYIYCIFATLFTIFLTSNTSLVFGVIMLLMTILLFKRRPIIMTALGLIGLLLLINSSDYLINMYVYMSQNDISGFLARYIGENTVFEQNIEVIKNSLGIGFTIIDSLDLGCSDSGYMIYLTMGHLPLLILIYYLLFRFLRNNIPKQFLWVIVFIIFSFELALPATFQYRFYFLMVFVIYYLQSLDYHYNHKREMKT